MTHLLNLTKWRFITINEMGRNKKLTGWYARRIAVGRDGEVQGVAQLLLKST